MCASHLLNRWLHGVSNTGEQEMVQVSLEQIQPFSLNPRVTRNPGYDVLKASILARGLDNPPVLTRRPGDEKYMLASGGNTRLAILNELWQETQDERYHRVCWPFRPWPETLSPQQGEVQCLIGHLAESDLHNGLMFIERAEGVLHLRALYLEAGIECPTQLALAEQLTRDGYPVSQSQISRMLQTVDWLLPCIPNALYGGLTRKVIDRLLALRSAAEQVWTKLMPLERQPEFADLFSTALATFNGDPEGVVPQLVQDELLGEMSCRGGGRC
ncbi:Protein with ParB-like nuclease domain in PFGI-1-like cluster [Enterobacter hormaechei]|uniref:ParB family protein n=1 Tax=Enterobacter hormaechei TaxID=158836 RepID=UPI000F6CF09B|nr:ParB family protein [Enterobacter hormaechei]VEB12639.1 Protein with ParB-like nuclease domain in PFGI-1-like cluster [Enterobacter hormaechei]